MEKKRGRVIAGWRQVARAKPGPSRPRYSPLAQAKAASEPRIAVPDAAANERWETEGGHLVTPAK
jgi:hypothetical protein